MLLKNDKTMTLSPIVLFVYNRPDHTKKTIEALQRNELASDSELLIFSDGLKTQDDNKKVREVRGYLKRIEGFRSVKIVEREKNYGLAQSIIEGVTEVVSKYGRIIVLEDDLVTSPYFLKYMNEALDFYENYEEVVSIHGYIYPVTEKLPKTFFVRGADCWGWATWKRGWDLFEKDGKKLLDELKNRKLTKEFDFNGSYPYTRMLESNISGLNDSWAIRWYASAFLADKLTLYPGCSLVKNIGMDASGTHSGMTSVYETDLAKESIKVEIQKIEETQEVKNKLVNYFKQLGYNSSISKLKFAVRKLLLCCK